jgi:predicted transcriptional regulator
MKGEITNHILRTLAGAPNGLTTREIIGLTGMTSYTVSGKLSKLAAYGRIDAVKIGTARMLWRFKPGAP